MANGTMGFGTPPAAAQPNLYDRLIGGLLGPTPAYGGLVDDEAKKAAQRQGLLAMASQLMAAGGPSQQRVSFGQALGPALMAGQQAQGQGIDQAMQAMLLKTKLQQASKKDKGKLVQIVGSDGKPAYAYEADAEGKTPYAKPGNEYGAYQPGDYTPESWAKFLQSKDPAVLVRYSTPRQEFSPSYQNVSRTRPDGSTEQGTFNTRTGQYEWSGAVVPPGQKARVEAAGRAEGDITGTRAAKSPVAYATYQSGIKSLEGAMNQTETGPVMGRIPAVTANQQIAEGAEATMAPVLKQLFRDAGEGTFTDSDQALLMKMVPTRKDHPEARKAKIEMIDGIVRAKLGIGGTPAPGAQQQEAPAAAIEYLRKNPQLKEQFKAKYGYLPDG